MAKRPDFLNQKILVLGDSHYADGKEILRTVMAHGFTTGVMHDYLDQREASRALEIYFYKIYE